jgi:F-type H+-transporting ATPase subunit gamma
MKMVAAAKLRRAQSDILAARPYAKKMLQMLNSLVKRVNPENHPLLRLSKDNNIELVIITGDKGLCGSFNTNIIKRSGDFLEERQEPERELYLNLIGRKGRDYFKKRRFSIRHEFVDIFRNLRYINASEMADILIEEYTNRELDAIYLVYNEFKSVLQQSVIVERLLPIGDLGFEDESAEVEYIFEPSERMILEELLPLHVRTQVWRALLESNAAEQAARMNAMENATQNAEEMIAELTKAMNKLRQQTITRQIIEVVSGADALKG